MIGGREPLLVHPAFCQYGVPGAVGPVVIAVSHAGREYPADLVVRARVGLSGLQSLEDRHVDALATEAIGVGHCAVIARKGRAILDLNRHEGEIDATSVSDIPHGVAIRASAKLRGGLGLVPHRYHSIGDLWLRRPPYAEVAERIRDIHQPYHAHVGQMLDVAASACGVAVLVDLHSMPPLRGAAGPDRVDVVLGDRFGQSASPAITRCAAEVIGGHGLRVAINAPYAGGYTLERHGRPSRAIHALQVEIDRSLYLDAALDQPGEGVGRQGRMIADLAQALGAALGDVLPLAAE
ncbi:N-formylglutamate amidohydrolase [Sphingobium sufflavum]|uniref:N-formylglutamate amidohydrolase n=1 Tax=Sphingobium sufflavum TaxID=1129547 RepID=UPI001F374205|nr:N-formylglutamate amidohydrolase [Sphingobium sufflavum]MCE7797324.1 N-formylglutamate amidohydrolase [Sphingobium sufflavum]